MSKGPIPEKYAKYPWSTGAAEYIKDQNIDLMALAKPGYHALVDRACTRVLDAINGVETPVPPLGDLYEECLSYPVARMLIETINDDTLRHRYATRESKRAEYFLGLEDEGIVLELIETTFHWVIKHERHIVDSRVFEYFIAFQDYVSIAPLFQDATWKMINRLVRGGFVSIDGRRLRRLMAEAVKHKIIRTRPEAMPKKMTQEVEHTFSDEITRIRSAWETVRRTWGDVSLSGEILVDAFPPCVRELLMLVREGQNISHLGRFTLATFLLHVGFSSDDILELFRKAPDFQQDLAKYQIRHIGGEIGTGKRYTPPSCATLQTNQLCRAGDDRICRWVKHPLSYYRKKRRIVHDEKQFSKTDSSQEPTPEKTS